MTTTNNRPTDHEIHQAKFWLPVTKQRIIDCKKAIAREDYTKEYWQKQLPKLEDKLAKYEHIVANFG